MNNKALAVTLIPIALAVIAGALIPVQGSSGAALGRYVGHPVWAAATSLSIAVLALVVSALLMKLPAPQVAQAIKAPWWVWVGGITGAIYVVTSLVLIPKVGAATFIVSVIGGQMIAALVLDHFGLLGLPVKPVTINRVVGIAVIFAGILIATMGPRLPGPGNPGASSGHGADSAADSHAKAWPNDLDGGQS